MSLEVARQVSRADCSDSDHGKETAYALVMGGKRHNMIFAPSLARTVFAQRKSTVSSDTFIHYVLKNFFGDGGRIARMDQDQIWGDLHVVLNELMREPFLGRATARLVKSIEQETTNLVTFSQSLVDQSVWERASNVRILPDSEPTAEMDLFPLVRNFVGDQATTILMGTAFTENNPHVLDDLWTFDYQFNAMLLGLPAWWPGMAPAYGARARLHRSMREFHQALKDVEEGKDSGFQWQDLSDVSDVIRHRFEAWRRAGEPVQTSAVGDLAILWAMNVNANPLAFWLLFRILSTPGLESQVLEELAPHIAVVQRKSDLPVPEPPSLSLDIAGLLECCPLFKASYFETLRVDSAAMTYKELKGDMTMTESPEDARLNGRSEPLSYHVSKGEFIAVPHGVHQADPKYFANPEKFDPRRFLVPAENDPSKSQADIRTMRPFGGGVTMCKGRTFAEREILAYVAAILTMWEISPAGGSRWKFPSHRVGSAVFLPASNVRIRIKRRT